jgi:flagellum-specific peptidoglycan hydrolase FlgJ
LCFILKTKCLFLPLKTWQDLKILRPMSTIRHFFKKNWFAIALLLLALIAVARRKIQLPVELPFQVTGSAEKYTTDANEPAASAANLGLLPQEATAKRRLPEMPEAETEAFLRRFSKVARSESRKFRVPASVLLAHAYVNSFAGRRNTAIEANNFTALVCGGDWEGATMELDGRCLRRYKTPWESYRDFSIFLAGQNWVAETRATAGMDWKPWVEAFAQNRLSNVEDYAGQMERIIKAYRLFELDDPANTDN